MISDTIRRQLQLIAKANNCDLIYELSPFNGKPVFQFRDSSIPKGAKTGRPLLFSLTDTGTLFELNSEQIHQVIISYNGFRKRIQ